MGRRGEWTGIFFLEVFAILSVYWSYGTEFLGMLDRWSFPRWCLMSVGWSLHWLLRFLVCLCLAALCPWVVSCCFVFFVEGGLLGRECVFHMLIWTFCAASKSNSAGSGASLPRGSLDQRLCVIPFAGRVRARPLSFHGAVAFFLGIQHPEHGNGWMDLGVLREGEAPVSVTSLQSSVLAWFFSDLNYFVARAWLCTSAICLHISICTIANSNDICRWSMPLSPN